MRKRQSLSLRRRLCNGGAAAALWVSALLCCALLLFLTGYIFYRGLPGISWDFLTGAESILQGTVGILPAIVNTLYVLLLSLAIALPLGAGAAIYLTEYARNRRLVEAVELSGHPWFVGVQFHPELKSRPNRAHPLFRAFIGAAKERSLLPLEK